MEPTKDMIDAGDAAITRASVEGTHNGPMRSRVELILQEALRHYEIAPFELDDKELDAQRACYHGVSEAGHVAARALERAQRVLRLAPVFDESLGSVEQIAEQFKTGRILLSRPQVEKLIAAATRPITQADVTKAPRAGGLRDGQAESDRANDEKRAYFEQGRQQGLREARAQLAESPDANSAAKSPFAPDRIMADVLAGAAGEATELMFAIGAANVPDCDEDELDDVESMIAEHRDEVREKALDDAMAALKKVGDFRGVAVVRKLKAGGSNDV